MRRISKIAGRVRVTKQTIMIICLQLILIIPARLFAQADSAKAVAGEEASLISPTIDFISVQKSDNTIDLKATIKAKIKGALTKLNGIPITFYSSPDSAGQELGKVVTDRNGLALLNYKADGLPADKEGKLHFKAIFLGDKSTEAAEEVLVIKRAMLIITPVKEDSVLSVNIKLVDLSTGNETAVPEINIGVFVKRLFNPLKIGEGKTDANGETIIEIPNNLPGDVKGNITLLGRLDDNEQYGNLEASVTQLWGKPVSDKIQELPRALWSPHPPLWMLITFIVLMATVWGHYIVILYELFRLRKEQPKATHN